MTKWIHTVDIKRIIDKYDEIGLEGVKSEMILELSKHSFIPKYFIDYFESVDDEAEFDQTLDTLYDYADEHRIWLGI